MSSNDKLKILFFGSIDEDNVQTVVSKLKSLQSSAAGPFDAAFCVGSCTNAIMDVADIPIPMYLHALDNSHGIVQGLPGATSADGSNTAMHDPQSIQDSVIILKHNLFLLERQKSLEQAAIWSLQVAEKKPELVIVNCPNLIRVDGEACKSLLESLKHVSYIGCDILLTGELPQGADRILSFVDESHSSNMSFDVADIALRARPRYHLVAATTFQQSSPFAHLPSTTTTTVTMEHIGRLITMAPVTSGKSSGKQSKYVHALGMVPLHACSAAELAAQKPATLMDNPYTDASYQLTGDMNNNSSLRSVGLSEASARRILAEEQNQRSGMPSQRWQQTSGSKRNRTSELHSSNDDNDEDPADPNNSTLFLHGLHKDVTGQLQQNNPGADSLILKALVRFGAKRVRRPPGADTSSFCFVDFANHAEAKACWEALGRTMTIHGVDLGVKWATSTKRQKQETSFNKPARLTEADAMDSSTIYFKIPGVNEMPKLGEAVRKWAEETLEDALAEGGEKVITAKEEPALQVTLRLPHEDVSYGFLDFASHAAGSMAVATLTGSTDGGLVQVDAKGRPDTLQEAVIYLHWSKAKTENESDLIEDASGFKFQRKHFPADARQDCWFCLASESCEKHLITGVFENCYAAMPKGPVHQGHVLLIPVQHSSEGALKSPEIAEEMDALKERLRCHASDAYDADLFVFERAIQTKGGYHTHVQCIPIDRNLGVRLQSTMQAQAKKIGFTMKEINSDIGIPSVLNSEGDDDEGEGYFYAEIPTFDKKFKRFVYKATAGSRVQVPLQFGREVLAAVLGKPELAHWKSCLVDSEQEAKVAAALRESLASIGS